jgi:hypothetical protein
MGAVTWPAWEQVEAGRAVEGGRAVPWEKDPRRHAQRAVPRVMIRVEAIPQFVDIGGYGVHAGVNYLLVYEDEVEAIRTKVATPDQLRQLADAERAYEIALRAHARIVGNTSPDPHRTVDDVLAEARQTFGATKWTFYSRNVNGTSEDNIACAIPGFPPLLSLEVCEERVKPPLNPHTYAAERDAALGAAVAEGVATALAKLNKKGAS